VIFACNKERERERERKERGILRRWLVAGVFSFPYGE
jgi:hypothetical protein